MFKMYATRALCVEKSPLASESMSSRFSLRRRSTFFSSGSTTAACSPSTGAGAWFSPSSGRSSLVDIVPHLPPVGPQFIAIFACCNEPERQELDAAQVLPAPSVPTDRGDIRWGDDAGVKRGGTSWKAEALMGERPRPKPRSARSIDSFREIFYGMLSRKTGNLMSLD